MNSSIVLDLAKLASIIWSRMLERIMTAIRSATLLMPLQMITGASKRIVVRITNIVRAIRFIKEPE
jgi:hypothetical protein